LARGIHFDLRIEDIIVPTHCPALGLELIFDKSTKQNRDQTASLDRIDPSLGYIRSNIAVISTRANRIKNDATADELDKIAQWLKALRPEQPPEVAQDVPEKQER
jgi:hypothetical protein